MRFWKLMLIHTVIEPGDDVSQSCEKVMTSTAIFFMKLVSLKEIE